MPQKNFDELLIESVDEAFSSIGESSKQAIYFHLEKRFKISKEEIPRRIRDFAEGIEKIFGLGAKFLEILIVRKLYERVGKPFELGTVEERPFIDHVEAAKLHYSKSKK
ncbi:MAG: hypothetical protein RMJ15_06610 [Nitrososphaerota archaeon]|nr:hypothetical protein [Candidatus Bathyarchaeota archaeon]MDW8023390.1 hypothetical protein [Nitrososphaerota archaeon]